MGVGGAGEEIAEIGGGKERGGGVEEKGGGGVAPKDWGRRE